MMFVSVGFFCSKKTFINMERVVDWKGWLEELVKLLLNSLSPCCQLLYFTSSLQLLTYRILNFTKDGIPDSVHRRIFYNSFRLWQSAAGIDIRECDRCREADILISFVQRRHVDRYPFDGQGGTLAHAFYPLSNKGKQPLPEKLQMTLLMFHYRLPFLWQIKPNGSGDENEVRISSSSFSG